MKNKKGTNLLYEVVIHVILIGLLFGLFFFAATGKVDSKLVKQQVLEKQLALLIDSANTGTVFEVFKNNRNGIIDNIELKQGRIFVYVEGLTISKGYPYFSEYDVSIDEVENGNKFYIRVE